MAAAAPAVRREHAARTTAREAPGLLGSLLRLAGWMILSLIASIAVECTGMALDWWEPPGAAHSRAMLAEEVGHLSGALRESAVVADTAAFARGFADTLYDWLWVRTGLEALVHWAARAPVAPGSLQEHLHGLYVAISGYVVAAATITQLFGVRLAVLTLSLPAFALAALVGFLDGLVRRDLRRWGGGRESSFLYHHARRWIWPVFIVAWVLYLSLPISIHPSLAVLPFAALFGLLIAVTSASFKKYL